MSRSRAIPAALHSLRRGGRLVLMGSMTTPLPLPYGEVIRNNWEIIGQFMYPAHAYRSLLGLLRAGLLDITVIRPRRFPLAELPEAMDAAATATSRGGRAVAAAGRATICTASDSGGAGGRQLAGPSNALPLRSPAAPTLTEPG